WFVRQHEIDPAAERWVRVAPPLDETWRTRGGFRVFGEFDERAGHRFVRMCQLEAEDIGLMLDVTRVAGVNGREQECQKAADGDEPGERGRITASVSAPAHSPSSQSPVEEPLG